MTVLAQSPDAERRNDVEGVVQTLEEDIIFGRLRPRERLTEDALLERFATKRHVVRQALAELARLGIVVKAPNKGAIVRDFTVAEVEEIYEMRELLHARAAQRMALPADPALVARLRDINARRTQAIDADDFRLVYALNDDFHQALFGACGNRHLAETISQYESLSHLIRSWRIGDAKGLRESQREHDGMIVALETGDRDRLVKLVVDHIKPSKKAYLAAHRWRRD